MMADKLESTAPFIYRGCQFLCGVTQTDKGLYAPLVRYDRGLPDVEQFVLPPDAEPYGTPAEAMRHAEQQAMRWVHDRTGDGQGQF